MSKNLELQNYMFANFRNFISIQLDDSNYVTWKFLVETLLTGCGLMRYVDGSFPCPLEYKTLEENGIASEIEQEYLSWVQNDCAAMSLLAATLSSNALSFIVGSKTSKEIWCRLKEKYVDASRYNIMKLKSSLYNIQKGSDSIDKYLLRVKEICDQLDTLGDSMDDEEIIVSVLHGLPSAFAVIKTIIRIKCLSSLVSMAELRSLLLIAEDEIDKSMTSISSSFEAAMAAFTDNSSATVSQIGHVPASTTMTANTGAVNSSIVLPIGIDSPMSTPGHLQFVTQVGVFPHSDDISQAASNVKASTGQPAYNANTVVNNGCPSPITDFGPQLPSNGHVLHPSTNSTQAFGSALSGFMSIHPQINGFSPGNGSFFSRKSRSRVIVCHSCGKRGHYAYNCYHRNSRPIDSASSSYTKCQICYCFGHVALACPQRPAARKIVSSGALLHCQICLQIGHSAAECLHRHHVQLPTSAKSQSMTASSSSQPTLCSSWSHGIDSRFLQPFSPG